ncbi:aminotransferase class I/II-fold pyridoxal phosphate-dependent enzyme [Candidatus Latescibacterota bacterium]
MWFKRMQLEEWFDKYQYAVQYDIGESAIKYKTFGHMEIDLSDIALRYGHHSGRADLKALIASQYENLTVENVIVTSGASEANFAIVAALVKPGDHVIVEHPNYTSLYDVPRALGCEVTLQSLKFEDKFKPDLDELKRLIKPNTKLISMTHPNNPTGSMISEKELHEIIKIAESNDVYLMFDETYRELSFGDPLPAAASLSPKVISISSMSKSFGLPGIRIGWLAAQDNFILDSVLAIREHISITNSVVGEEIAVRVLEKTDTYIKSALDHALRNFKLVKRWMNNQDKLEWIQPEAGVVSMPRIKAEVKIDPEELWRLLVEKYKTFIIPGRCFEVDNRYFRLGYGSGYDEIKIGLNNLKSAIDEITER